MVPYTLMRKGCEAAVMGSTDIRNRNRMTGLHQGLYTLWSLKRSIAIGSIFSLSVMVSFLAVGTFAEGSFSQALTLVIADAYIVAPIMITVGVSTGLASYVRRLDKFHKTMHCSTVGSVTSTVSMISCCLHHFTDVLASASVALSTSASFLAQYRVELVAVGIIFNLLGSGLMVRTILRYRTRAKKEGMSRLILQT